jgi:hypothetical protein
MIMQIKTEKELIEMVQALKKEIDKLTASNKLNAKRFKLIQAEIDKKPNVEVKETVIKEIEKPTVIKETVIQTDPSVLPTLKKLSDRLKTLEDKKPEKQIIKEVTIKEVKPVINNVTTGLDDNQVLELINKHVTMNYINKLYKKGN